MTRAGTYTTTATPPPAYALAGHAYAPDRQTRTRHTQEAKGAAGIQDYGFRNYFPSIGRFTSIDPLTAQYPELSSYQYASNSPIAGIDLDGLEFLDANAALFEMRMGKAYLKVENQSSVTQSMVAQAKFAAGTDANGQPWVGSTFSTEIMDAQFEMPRPVQRKLPPKVEKILTRTVDGYPGYNRQQRRGNNAIARRTGRVPNSSRSAGPPRSGNGGAGLGILEVASTFIAAYKVREVSNDFGAARAQYEEFGRPAVEALEISINNGLVIPDAISGDSELSDVINYMVSGELLYNDSESESGQQIIEVARFVMYENDIPDRSQSPAPQDP